MFVKTLVYANNMGTQNFLPYFTNVKIILTLAHKYDIILTKKFC